MDQDSPVLLTGATGFVGRAVVCELLRRKIPVKALVRSINSGRSLSPSGGADLQFVCGDINDTASLLQALSGITRIIHLVGIISEAGRVTFENIHTRGTANLVKAAETAGVKRFVHM